MRSFWLAMIIAAAVPSVFAATVPARAGDPLEDAERMQRELGPKLEGLSRQQMVSLCEDRFPYSANMQEVCAEKQRIGKAGVDKLRNEMWRLRYTGDQSDRRLSDTMRLFDTLCTKKASANYRYDWVEQFYCFKHKIDEAAAAGRVLSR